VKNLPEAYPTANGSNKFIDQVNKEIKAYDSSITPELASQGITGLNLTVEKMATKLGYRYDNIKTDRKKVIAIIFEYFDKTTVPNEISQGERFKNQLIEHLPTPTDNFRKSQRYLQQNKGELNIITKLRKENRDLTFKEWIDNATSGTDKVPFQLSIEEMYEILASLVRDKTIPMVDLLTLRQKEGKGKENKEKYFTRIFNDIPEIRPIILTGQLRRSNFISLFDPSKKPVLKPRLPALSSSSDY
jgi:hypothetical protein